MREVLPALRAWWDEGATVGLATVVHTFRSAPRPPGASMLVGPDGSVVGSVSGGCVEGAVYEAAREVVATGRGRVERYGVSDDDAFAVGLTCGGVLDVAVEPVSRHTFPELGALVEAVAAERPVATATVVAHPDPDRVGRRLLVGEVSGGSLGSARLDAAVADDAAGMLAAGATGVLVYGVEGERRGEGCEVFVHSFAPPPRMIVFGAIDFAAAMSRAGAFLGYRVTVCDARPLFATAARFPHADEVVVDQPFRYLAAERDAGRLDGRTVLVLLTHDPKFDVPLLEVALRLPVPPAYVGAMGSRRTDTDRRERLRERGLTDTELAALSGPVGLDLGGRTPEETAISIAAEIVARRWGGTGLPLSQLTSAVHHS
ncbi:XdhC/CoxI family protein [Nocardioides sp. GY 10127]|uniref:XdhC family protein n=1 Tax=Nocardioides sp. GY 10127 TaxID=2569762 RepID=UPI0010A8A65A|nr:XdhC/CoxI family protein [Nocardioides sp. GY 10127]TIC79344.1 XdhC family protein [Nocardioides sp. GY 10127]